MDRHANNQPQTLKDTIRSIDSLNYNLTHGNQPIHSEITPLKRTTLDLKFDSEPPRKKHIDLNRSYKMKSDEFDLR